MKDGTGELRLRLERFQVTAGFAATKPRLQVGEYVRLSVRDTGQGMSAETLRRIFEPFFTTKAPGSGTGLGLSAVHGIMDNHEGGVTVQSEPGVGTVFHLYFPASANRPPARILKEEDLVRGHGERILVVDDEESVARLMTLTLVGLGYEVESATTAVEALALVAANPGRFGLILSDQTMPHLTGLALAQQVRLTQPKLPVILMTGYSLSLTAERAEEAGVCQVLLKPVPLSLLAGAVQAALHGAEPVGLASPSPLS
jgi:CheY-like chemotaxis protein